MNMRLKGDWYVERLTRDEVHGHLVSRRVAKVKTPFQTAEVVDTKDYGRCLFLDGLVQSTESDEFIYHESLIHPALMLHPRPEKVFIAGGGEGANVREIIKHPSVRDVVMVEIDEKVVGLAKKFLGKWHQGSYNDPRLKLYYQDARAFLLKDPTRYDALFLDLCDPGEGGPARKLFTVEFYRLLRSRLTPNGLAAIQAGSANFNMAKGFSGVYQSLRKAFPVVLPYLVCVPAYVGPWAFFLAGNAVPRGASDMRALEERFQKRKLEGRTRFYDPAVHRAVFSLPPYYREMLGRGRSISEKNALLIKRG
jgi:spermidine synthase